MTGVCIHRPRQASHISDAKPVGTFILAFFCRLQNYDQRPEIIRLYLCGKYIQRHFPSLTIKD